MSFKVKTILLFLLISLVPYIITMLLFGSSLRSEQLRSVTQEMKTQLAMTIDRIDREIGKLRQDMAFMAKSDLMNDIFTEDLDRRISRMLQSKKEDLALIGDFYVVGETGGVIASSDFSAIGKTFDTPSRFKAAIYSPFDATRIATLHVRYDLENLQSFFTNSEHRHYFIDTAGQGEQFRSMAFEAVVQVRETVPSLEKVEVVLEEDKAYAYRLVRKYEQWFIAILAGGGLFIFLAALFFAVKLIRPLIALSNTAKKVTATQDYSQQVAVERSDEIGQLGESFNRMIAGMDHALHEITSLNLEIEDTQREVVFTMGAIGESRSKETGNHVKRVAEYSRLFALYYGLREEEAEMLKQASPMHDIGKVAIPDAILNKPGRFTEEEFEHMKLHAQLGYDMLKGSHRPLLKAAAVVAYEHHEKYNGTGYPRGLFGEDIHIYGRITAVADVFDALGSDRVYKEAWEDERIFALFKAERGEHFDPKLVDIFFEHLDEFLAIRSAFRDI